MKRKKVDPTGRLDIAVLRILERVVQRKTGNPEHARAFARLWEPTIKRFLGPQKRRRR